MHQAGELTGSLRVAVCVEVEGNGIKTWADSAVILSVTYVAAPRQPDQELYCHSFGNWKILQPSCDVLVSRKCPV